LHRDRVKRKRLAFRHTQPPYPISSSSRSIAALSLASVS
jgi:hypothetical protein